MRLFLSPDQSEVVGSLEDGGLNTYQIAATTRLPMAAGEPRFNTVDSIHAAELCWLNHIEPCFFPITLCAKILSTTRK